MSKLTEKRAKYAGMKQDILAYNYDAEINDKVEAYRVQLVDEARQDRASKLAKVDDYLDILDELIAEEEAEATSEDDTHIKEIQQEV